MFTLKYTLLVDVAASDPVQREEHSVTVGPWKGREYPEQIMCELIQRYAAALVRAELVEIGTEIADAARIRSEDQLKRWETVRAEVEGKDYPVGMDVGGLWGGKLFDAIKAQHPDRSFQVLNGFIVEMGAPDEEAV